MTRQEQLQEIDNKYASVLLPLQEQLDSIQRQYNDYIAQKQQITNDVNAYYDAIDQKLIIDPIVAKGAPDTKK